MFILYEMVKDVETKPINLNLERTEALRDELNRMLSNRIILNVGLCMILWDIKDIGTPTIFPGDGSVHSRVTFRYIIFRPFQDEILVGKIKSCTPEGVHVSLGFFDDILITPERLQYPSRFDEREQLWVWEYKTGGEGDEEEEKHEMFMDKGETLRFRVISEQFSDTTPLPSASSSSSTPSNSAPVEENQGPKTPYSIIGSINEPGLGLLSWWS